MADDFYYMEMAISALSYALLHDEDTGVRFKAVESLEKIGHVNAIPILQKALQQDQNAEVRQRIVVAIGTLCSTLQTNLSSQTTAQTIQIFFSYSHRDEDLRDELETHLSILKWHGVINSWHDRQIIAGSERFDEINTHLDAAHIILLLVSPDFLSCSYCYGKEVMKAMERHGSGAYVIPIILRPVDWKGAPFGKLQALPKDAQPITTWINRDEAFLDVACGIRVVAEQMKARR